MYKLQLYVNKGNDHQLKKLLIFKQILLVSTLGNVKRTVWRICLLMLGCKRLKASSWVKQARRALQYLLLNGILKNHFNRVPLQFTCTCIYS